MTKGFALIFAVAASVGFGSTVATAAPAEHGARGGHEGHFRGDRDGGFFFGFGPYAYDNGYSFDYGYGYGDEDRCMRLRNYRARQRCLDNL